MSAPARPEYDLPDAPIDVQQSLENLKLERDAIALYDELAKIGEGSAPRGGLPDDRGQRAPSRRHLGRQAGTSGRPCRSPTGPGCASGRSC